MLFDDITQKYYSPREYPALAALAAEWSETRPFEGLKILVATPIFRNSLLQYEALLAGGAELFAGRAVEHSAIPCDIEIVELLQESEIPVLSPEMVLDMEQDGDFLDLILDCAGQFAACHPKMGFVELTRTGVPYYENAELPVFVADSGIIKRIETSLGTGDGFFRGLFQSGFAEFEGKSLLVFGSGKVGCGIALHGVSRGMRVCTITDTERRESASDFIPTLELNDVEIIDKRDIPDAVKKIESADFIVTATGVRHALSDPEIHAALLRTGAVIACMGAEDEFSDDMPEDRVLNKKFALNFILEEPTHLKYIDASLALHAALAERLILESEGGLSAETSPRSGLRNPPEEIEQKLLGITLQNGDIGEEISQLLGLQNS